MPMLFYGTCCHAFCGGTEWVLISSESIVGVGIVTVVDLIAGLDGLWRQTSGVFLDCQSGYAAAERSGSTAGHSVSPGKK
jgi:hypothetical protein